MEKIVWTKSSEIVDKNFNYMIKNYYNHFNFKYRWEGNQLIVDYLKRLFISSFIENEDIRNDLPILIHNVEDFFATGINTRLFNKSNIVNVYKRLKDNVKLIGYTSKESEPSNYTSEGILINKDLRVYLRNEKQTSLSPVEMRKLYLFRELSKKVLLIKDENLVSIYNKTIEKVLEEKNSKIDLNLDKSLIIDGFEMIEDLVAQNLAEELAYTSSDKTRPKFMVKIEKNIPVVSNLDDRGIFEKQVVNFGKTLAGISTKSDNETLLNMAKLSLEASLGETIIAQYKEGNAQKYYDLFILLQNFGVLYRGNTKVDNIYTVNYKNIFSILDEISKRNLGNNLLMINSIKPLNLDKYLNA